MKKKLSSAWLIVSLFVLPAVLDLENAWNILFIMANVVLSYKVFTHHNDEYLIDKTITTNEQNYGK